MLTLLPVDAAPIPRVHVEPLGADGSFRVFDRPSGEYLLVYTPRFTRQFATGHRAGRWYVRPVNFVGSEPQSANYPTAKAAIDALRAGRWNLNGYWFNRAGLPLRVIWSIPGTLRN